MPRRGLTILLVEDDESNRKMLRTMLRTDGHTVVECLDGLAAQDLLLGWKTPVDLVVLDVCMPVLDGLGLCKVLRKFSETLHLPVIMVSARGQQRDIAAGLEAGADAYLVKPFRSQDLRAAIARVLPTRSGPLLR